jgi:ectoine hydroxylase-related dioxygenase (phytanoyl-CoA dioxygenase family)
MIDDLSTCHKPVSDLFPHPRTSADWVRYRLNEEQVSFFKENGYLAGIRVLTDSQINALRSELERFFDPNHAGRELWYDYFSNESTSAERVLFHALGAWRIAPGFHDMLWNPAFLVPASQLLTAVCELNDDAQGSGEAAPVRFWHDQLFCKPAHHGGVVAWHQDYSYWQRTSPMAHLSCWTGLDRATQENGCLHYVPGSHRWDLLPLVDLADNMEAIHEVLSEEQEAQFDPVAIELEVGVASFHHPLMVHGSYENRSNRPRRGTVINVFRDGVRSNSDEALLAGVPPIPKGEKIQGRFFPLLFDPQEVNAQI